VSTGLFAAGMNGAADPCRRHLSLPWRACGKIFPAPSTATPGWHCRVSSSSRGDGRPIDEPRQPTLEGAGWLNQQKRRADDTSMAYCAGETCFVNTLEFICGPACHMMAMKYYQADLVLDRALELRLLVERGDVDFHDVGSRGIWTLWVGRRRPATRTDVGLPLTQQ
jgi:hypothetical protein